MVEFPISWQFRLPENYSLPPVYVQKQLDEVWTLKCEWCPVGNDCYDYGYLRNENTIVVEIRRNWTVGEFFVSGKLKLTSPGIPNAINKMFAELLEADCPAIRKPLRHNAWRLHSSLTFKLDGNITIGRNTEDLFNVSSNKVDSKIFQMDSLMGLSNDFEQLMNQKASSYFDVNLKCGSIIIPAHKNILSARSPVFAAMFKNDMKEGKENKVDIIDLEESVLRALLTYMYAGKTGALTVSSAADLLFAADKYQVLGLKKVCGSYLKTQMSLSSAVSILVLGYLHDLDLKKFALDFMCHKCGEFSEIEKTEDWKKLQKEEPALSIEVLTALVKAQEVMLKSTK